MQRVLQQTQLSTSQHKSCTPDMTSFLSSFQQNSGNVPGASTTSSCSVLAPSNSCTSPCSGLSSYMEGRAIPVDRANMPGARVKGRGFVVRGSASVVRYVCPSGAEAAEAGKHTPPNLAFCCLVTIFCRFATSTSSCLTDLKIV